MTLVMGMTEAVTSVSMMRIALTVLNGLYRLAHHLLDWLTNHLHGLVVVLLLFNVHNLSFDFFLLFKFCHHDDFLPLRHGLLDPAATFRN